MSNNKYQTTKGGNVKPVTLEAILAEFKNDIADAAPAGETEIPEETQRQEKRSYPIQMEQIPGGIEASFLNSERSFTKHAERRTEHHTTSPVYQNELDTRALGFVWESKTPLHEFQSGQGYKTEETGYEEAYDDYDDYEDAPEYEEPYDDYADEAGYEEDYGDDTGVSEYEEGYDDAYEDDAYEEEPEYEEDYDDHVAEAAYDDYDDYEDVPEYEEPYDDYADNADDTEDPLEEYDSPYIEFMDDAYEDAEVYEITDDMAYDDEPELYDTADTSEPYSDAGVDALGQEDAVSVSPMSKIAGLTSWVKKQLHQRVPEEIPAQQPKHTAKVPTAATVPTAAEGANMTGVAGTLEDAAHIFDIPDTYDNLDLDPSYFNESPQGEKRYPLAQETGDVYTSGIKSDTDDYTSLDTEEVDSHFDSSAFAATKENPLRKAAFAALAAIAAVREKHQAEVEAEEQKLEAEDKEIPIKQGHRYYSAQIKPINMRAKFATVLTAILLYISLGFPAPGALGSNVKVASLFCLITLLSVMYIGLDIVTAGILGFVRRRPGGESLVVFSCITSIIDAIYIYNMGDPKLGLPFCGVSALALTMGIWGAQFICVGFRHSFRNAGLGKSPCVAAVKKNKETGEIFFMKAHRDTTGFVRRSEEADMTENAYVTIVPFMIIVVLVLSLVAAFAQEKFSSFFHIISALAAGGTTLSALISFSLPFSLIARGLTQAGAAISGNSGAHDIARSTRIVITDADLFPPETLSFDEIRFFEGTYTDKVISYTASIIRTSECGLTPLFEELSKKNNCSAHPVDEFVPHEGGGYVAKIRGDQVHVGSPKFMTLIGIRLPHSMMDKNVVLTAINGVLVGVFHVHYEPLESVQEALMRLQDSNLKPYFAIRDFNITPRMIHQVFKVPTDGFEFPPFSSRFAISGNTIATSPVAAVMARDSLLSFVEVAVAGKRLYKTARLNMFLSIIGSFAGIIMMFFLCNARAFDSAGVSNALHFLILWLIPGLVLSFGTQR